MSNENSNSAVIVGRENNDTDVEVERKQEVERRVLLTPCCNHQQITKKNVGEIVHCSSCKGAFVYKD